MTESKDTAARFVAAFNAHDEKALNELHSDDIKFSAPGGFKATNAKDATAYATTWLKAFPDGKMKVRSEITSGPWAVQEVSMEGTHTAVVLLRNLRRPASSTPPRSPAQRSSTPPRSQPCCSGRRSLGGVSSIWGLSALIRP